MELRDYFNILKRRGWLIILLAILTAIAAYLFSSMQTEIYKSSVTIQVSPKRVDNGTQIAVKARLQALEDWMGSTLQAQQVIDILQYDMDPGSLTGKVRTESNPDRFNIRVEALDSSPDTVQPIVQKYADLLDIEIKRLNADQRNEDRLDVQQIDNPSPPALHSPQKRINTIAGGIFGGLLGLILIFLLEWIASGILRRSEDIEKQLEIPVIGKIPK